MLKSTSNLIKALICLIALVCSSQAFAQEKSITIYNGTDTNKYIPFYFYYFDDASATSQFIYPAESLKNLKGKQITGITFYNEGYTTSWNGNMAVSLAEVDFATLDNENSSYIKTDFKEVFNGAISGDETMNTLEFSFNEPFAYNSQNLVIEIKNTVVGSTYMQIPFYGKNTDAINATYGYSNSFKYNQKFLPKATITYEELPEYGARVSTDNIDFATLFTNKETTQEIKITNTGKNDITATITGVEAPFSVNATSINVASTTSVTIPVTFAPTADGKYSGTIIIDLAEAGSYEVAVFGNAMSSPTGYTQDFNVENKTLPQNWTGLVIKDSYDFNSGSYVYESSEINNDYFVGTEIFGTKGVTIKDNTNPCKVYPNQYIIYMVSPLVSGNVLFSAIGTNVESYTIPEVSAYKVSADENGAFVIDNEPINIIWQSPLTNADWSYAIFSLDEPTQIAFFMSYGAISMFACDAEGQATGINNIAANNSTNCVLNGEDLTINSNANLVAYQVTSISGATVACGDLYGKNAEVKLNVPAGVYVITITSESGASVHKLLKK